MRIDSYESEEAQKIVRSYLNGRFENTAFCILSPDGKQRLTRSHRGPSQALGGDLAEALGEISRKYSMRGRVDTALVPDFPNFRLALNVASADQRLLISVVGEEAKVDAVREQMKAIANSDELIGRVHYDFHSSEAELAKALGKANAGAGIRIVLPDTFGQTGKVMNELPINATMSDLKEAILKANKTFAETTEKKVYSDHVRAGRQQGVEWTMPMEYGEDRDGDGVIDFRGGMGRRPRR